MGTIFKYNNQLIQCQNLQKKLKRMRLTEADIEIIKDNIPENELEKEFVNLTRVKKEEVNTNSEVTYYIFENSKGNYLLGYNKPDITHYTRDFGFDISDYKLIDTCTGDIPDKYRKWNPETKTGLK